MPWVVAGWTLGVLFCSLRLAGGWWQARRLVAEERIESTLPLDESAMTGMTESRSAPKVAFGVLVESGLVPPGATLTDAKQRWKAVRSAGSICSSNASRVTSGVRRMPK